MKKSLFFKLFGAIAFVCAVGVNAYGDAPGACDQCVLKNDQGAVIFSCKSMPNETCTAGSGGQTLSCNGAKQC